MKRILIPLTFAPVLCLLLTSGCSKSKSPAGSSESPQTNAAMQEELSPPAGVAATSTSPKPSTRPAEIVPLSTEVIAMVKTNTAGNGAQNVYAIDHLNLTPTQKAQAFLLLLPSQNREGQREFARAASSHVDDSTYSLIREPLIEGKLDVQILSIFMTDTLKRPNRVKVPTLVTLAGTAGHPMQAEARQLLTAFFGQDHGTNLAEWKQNMDTWLAKNPN